MTLAVLTAGDGNALDPADAARLADDLTDALRAAGATVVESLDAGAGRPARLRRDRPACARRERAAAGLCRQPGRPSESAVDAGHRAGRPQHRAGRRRPRRATCATTAAGCCPRPGSPAAPCATSAPSASRRPTCPPLAKVADRPRTCCPPCSTPAWCRSPPRCGCCTPSRCTPGGAGPGPGARSPRSTRTRRGCGWPSRKRTTSSPRTRSAPGRRWSPAPRARLGLSPSGVTALSVLFAVAAALALLAGVPARDDRRRDPALPGLRAGLRGRPAGPLHPPVRRVRRLAGHDGRPRPRSTRSTPGWPPAPSGSGCRTPGRWRSPRSCCRPSGT